MLLKIWRMLAGKNQVVLPRFLVMFPIPFAITVSLVCIVAPDLVSVLSCLLASNPDEITGPVCPPLRVTYDTLFFVCFAFAPFCVLLSYILAMKEKPEAQWSDLERNVTQIATIFAMPCLLGILVAFAIGGLFGLCMLVSL